MPELLRFGTLTLPPLAFFLSSGDRPPPPPPDKRKMKGSRRDEITFVEAQAERKSVTRPPANVTNKKQIDGTKSAMGSMLLTIEHRDTDTGPKVSGKAQEIIERKKQREEAAARKRAEKMEEAARAKRDAAEAKSRALADKRTTEEAAAAKAAAVAAQRERDAQRAAADNREDLDQEDAELINNFFNKIKKELEKQ